MGDRTPSVTVLMAVYNGERFVREAVESILSQTFDDFEFLIDDDGSTDRTAACSRAHTDPRIRLITNPANLGLTRSLNRGLAQARGAYIARQDADDISMPDRLARQVAYLEAHPEVALLGTWYAEIDAQGNVVHRWQLPTDTTHLRWNLLFLCPFIHTAAMFRAAMIQRVGPYDETFEYAQDYELWRRIARQLPVANLAEYLVSYRVNPDSMTATYGDRALEGHRLSVRTVAGMLRWSDVDVGAHDARFRALAALAFGHRPELPLQQLLRAVPALVALHAAFCREYRIAGRARLAHRRRALRRAVAHLFERAERRVQQGDTASAWTLVLLLGRLQWSALRSRPGVRLLHALVRRLLRRRLAALRAGLRPWRS